MNYKQVALDFCNEVRQEVGLPPVPALSSGRPKHACGCPVSNTIAEGSSYLVTAFASTVVWSFEERTNLFSRVTPEDVFNFITAFDAGKFPELIAK